MHLGLINSQVFNTGVGKVRPAGQIRPAEVFCPARGADFTTQSTYVLCKIIILVLCYLKEWREGPQIFLNGPRTTKFTHSCFDR